MIQPPHFLDTVEVTFSTLFQTTKWFTDASKYSIFVWVRHLYRRCFIWYTSHRLFICKRNRDHNHNHNNQQMVNFHFQCYAEYEPIKWIKNRSNSFVFVKLKININCEWTKNTLDRKIIEILLELTDEPDLLVDWNTCCQQFYWWF